jgi:L-histidine Nalpha-methyltransferase / hercynylcysteine S-oxide synthase
MPYEMGLSTFLIFFIGFECLTGNFRNLRKIEILLKEFENQGKNVDYYALDLSLEELHRTFTAVSSDAYLHVRFHGLHGTYDDALAWLQNPENRKKATCVLSMGSSIGNFSHSDAAEFLGRFAQILGPRDCMMIALDACKDMQKVFDAYNDSKGITQQFYKNGLAHANQTLGYEAFKEDDWQIETLYDEAGGRHLAFYVPIRDVRIQDVDLHKGEKILFEEACKYRPEEQDQLWRKAGLIPMASYRDRADNYRKQSYPTPPLLFFFWILFALSLHVISFEDLLQVWLFPYSLRFP